MQINQIFVSALTIYWLSICGLGAQNHQALAVRELDARGFHGPPHAQVLPTMTPQASSSSSSSKLTTAPKERMEKLEELQVSMEKLESELKKVRREQGENWEKSVALLISRISYRRCQIRKLTTSAPRRGNSALSLDHLPQRVQKLAAEHDHEHNQERKKRLEKRLGAAHYMLNFGEKGVLRPTEKSALDDTEKRKEPTSSIEKQMDLWAKKVADLEVKINLEHDPAEKTRLRRRCSRVKHEMNKAAGMTKKYNTSRKGSAEIAAEIAELEEKIKKETERTRTKRLKTNVRDRKRWMRNMAEEEEEERRQAEGNGPRANEKIDGELQTETEGSNFHGVEGEQDFNVLGWDQDTECSGKDFDYDSLLNMSDDELRNWLETTE